MRLFVFVLLILAVAALFFLPDPEKLVIKVVERASLVLILARGLAGYYTDLVEVIEASRQRHKSPLRN